MAIPRRFVLLFCVSATLVWGQLYSGSATGVVTDPSGASIPGAKVSLVDEGKGFAYNGETDASGRYLFRSLQPASYKITVTAQGFQVQERTGIRIDVNQNVTVDFALPVATSAANVTITGESPILSTADAAVGQEIDRRFINDLPLTDHDIMSLAYLTPGVVTAYGGNPWLGGMGNNFSSNGGRASTNDVLLDGVTTTNYEQNGGVLQMSFLPSPEAIQEFKVQTSNFSAEFGATGAAIVNMVLRSGTNAFHGTVYEYLRNQKLDSNDFFSNGSGTPLPALRRNSFGGVIGGPIKKNKTFFFADYDGLRQSTGQTYRFGVPSAAERQGNFGELCGYNGGTFDSAGVCSAAAGQLWDPYSGTFSAAAGGAVRSSYIPFDNLATYVSPGNPNLNGTGYQLAPTAGNLIDPVAQKLMAYMPLPNLNVGTPSYTYWNNWIGASSTPGVRDQFDIKIDESFSDKTLLSGKFSYLHAVYSGTNCFKDAADPCDAGNSLNKGYLASLNLNHTFSPTLLLTVSYGFNRGYAFEPDAMGDYPNADPVKALGLPSYMYRSGLNTFPAVTLGDTYADGPAGDAIGTWPWCYNVSGGDTHQLLATMSWIKGSHEVKFGVDGRMHRINYFLPGPADGYFNFDYTSTSQTPTYGSGGDAMASFLTGVGTNHDTSPSSNYYEVPGSFSSQNFQWAGFAQDNWKVMRSLTVNVGLRYDLTMPRTERYNRMDWLDPNAVSPLQVPSLGTLHGGEVFASPNDREIYNPNFTNFQPRFGFAWNGLKKTVVRGGYGIFYSQSKASVTGTSGYGHQGYVKDTPWITSLNNDGSTPWGRLSDPWPITGPNLPPGNSLGLLNDVGFRALGPIRTLNTVPYEQSWSLGIQRELPWSILLEASYVGRKGTHLYYGASGEMDILGPQIEQYSASQIAGLLSYVSNPFYGVIKDPSSALSAPTIQAYQLQVPYPQFTSFRADDLPVANSIYHAFQMRAQKRFSSGLQFMASYTFSKAIDDSSVSSNNNWQANITMPTTLRDPNRRYLERSVSLFDITNVLEFTHVYELPFGRGKKVGANWNPVVNGVLGGWAFNGVWKIDSGFPLIPSLLGGFNLPTYGPQMPDLVGTPARNTGSNWMTQYFSNPNVFTSPAPYALGDAPRLLSWVRAQGVRNADLSLFKQFPISRLREGARMEFRVQALNSFNHPQFAPPNMTVGSDSFGMTTSQWNSPRQVEFGAKLYF